ncbi:MAG: LD-carboxypeptidase [Elusimicrobiota bacterium]|nr:LD-carboxypeptidase [Endomicrobiia bacterium]MDW8165526.1 LD-carboxypeptidase [Elusimicrobiota bacterium]
MNTYIITPSWIIRKKSEFKKGIKILESLGFKIINKNFPTKILSIKQKVNQIHKAFLDENIKIIIAQRGGYGCIKLLPYLNFEVIKHNPKIFAGFSDISILLNIIYEKTGLVTLHSPMIINFSNTTKFTINSFMNAINSFKNKQLFDKAPIKVFKHGKSQGILKGGNLITLTSTIGTPWEINTKDCILFLEEVNEELYKVDRAITQWILAKKFNSIKGLILGDFRGLKVEEVFRILKQQIKITFPVVSCKYIGHVKNKITLPIGAKVQLDTFNKSLLLL